MDQEVPGSDSEAILTCDHNFHQCIDYVRTQEETLNAAYCSVGNIAVNPQVESCFDERREHRRRDMPEFDSLAKPPRRPMTSYNIFFLLERERIISGGRERKYTAEDAHKMVALQKWKDANCKRKHRKSHGIISFKDLSIRAAASWRKMDEASKKVFHDCAALEKTNYAKALSAWKKRETIQGGGASPIRHHTRSDIGNYQTPLPNPQILEHHDVTFASMHLSRQDNEESDEFCKPHPIFSPSTMHHDVGLSSSMHHTYQAAASVPPLPEMIQFPRDTNLTILSSGECAVLSPKLDCYESIDTLGSWVGKGEDSPWICSTSSPPLMLAKTDSDDHHHDAIMDDGTVGTFNP